MLHGMHTQDGLRLIARHQAELRQQYGKGKPVRSQFGGALPSKHTKQPLWAKLLGWLA